MKNSPYVETRKDGFFIDTLLDSDPKTRQVKAEAYIESVLTAAAPNGVLSQDGIIDLYNFFTVCEELEDFSNEEIEQMLGNCLNAL